MDAAALTSLVMALLAPLSHREDADLLTDVNDASYQYSQRLYELIRKRFADVRDEGRANQALQMFLEDAENGYRVEKKLFPLLQTDPSFADDVRSMIQHGPRPYLTPQEEHEARRIRTHDTLATGRKEIRARKYSILEDVQINVS